MSLKVSQSYKKFNLRINVTIISLTTDGRSYVDLPHASLTQEVTPCEQEQTLQLSTMSINVAPSGTIVPDTLQAEMQTIGGDVVMLPIQLAEVVDTVQAKITKYFGDMTKLSTLK